MAFVFDPSARPDPERDERLHAATARVEIRPAERVAWLGSKALACPECGVPLGITAPIRWSEEMVCAFCDAVAPTREFVRDRGWPPVDLIARLG